MVISFSLTIDKLLRLLGLLLSRGSPLSFRLEKGTTTILAFFGGLILFAFDPIDICDSFLSVLLSLFSIKFSRFYMGVLSVSRSDNFIDLRVERLLFTVIANVP